MTGSGGPKGMTNAYSPNQQVVSILSAETHITIAKQNADFFSISVSRILINEILFVCASHSKKWKKDMFVARTLVASMSLGDLMLELDEETFLQKSFDVGKNEILSIPLIVKRHLTGEIEVGLNHNHPKAINIKPVN